MILVCALLLPHIIIFVQLKDSISISSLSFFPTLFFLFLSISIRKMLQSMLFFFWHFYDSEACNCSIVNIVLISFAIKIKCSLFIFLLQNGHRQIYLISFSDILVIHKKKFYCNTLWIYNGFLCCWIKYNKPRAIRKINVRLPNH